MADWEMTYCGDSCSNQGTRPEATCSLFADQIEKINFSTGLKIQYFIIKVFREWVCSKNLIFIFKNHFISPLNWSFVWGKPVWCFSLQDSLIVDTAVLEDKKILLKPDLFFWYEKFLKDQISPVKHKTKYKINITDESDRVKLSENVVLKI